jgi:protease-4
MSESDMNQGSRSPIDPSAAQAAPPPPYPPYMMYAPPPAPPPKRSFVGRMFSGALLSLFILSILANLYFAAILGALMSGPRESVLIAGDARQRILVIPIEGIIDETKYDFVFSVLQSIHEDKKNRPKAIILRVDSPGGYVGPSDRILHEINRFKKKHAGIPIIASFGSVAASGGYYVAAGCDAIYAEPTCITGSIGVIGQTFTVEELMKKLGVTPHVIVADGSPKKDVANNMFRTMNEADQAKLKEILNNAHEQFVSVVAEGRKAVLRPEEVRPLANGDTYNTKQAIANKLIDGEGYLDAVIEEAKQRANISGDPQVTVAVPPRSFGLLSAFLGKAESQAAIEFDGEKARTFLHELSSPRIEFLWRPGM